METIARTPLQLGNSIRQRRCQLGLTQDRLAAKIGMRQRTVSDVETSAARVDTLLRTLAALDLELVIRPSVPRAHTETLKDSSEVGCFDDCVSETLR